MIGSFLRRAVAAAALAASAACVHAVLVQAQEPASRPAAAPPANADSLLDRAAAPGAAAAPADPQPADPPPAAAAAVPERAQAPEPAVPEVGFDEPDATAASRSADPSPKRKTVRAAVAHDEARTARSSERARASSETPAVRPRAARATVVERSTAGKRAESGSVQAERPIRPKLRVARERETQSGVRRSETAERRTVTGPRFSGLELARRAARRHAVDEPRFFADEPDYGERLVVVRPWRYGRVYVVEE